MIKTKLISAFPGCGKTWCYNNLQASFSMIDSDSSEFSWHPNFPANYIDHIKSNIGKYEFIFISTHEVVRTALLQNDLQYYLVYPDISCKEEYLQRFEKRGSAENFIFFINKNWDKFIKSIENNHHNAVFLHKLNSGEFLDKELLIKFKSLKEVE